MAPPNPMARRRSFSRSSKADDTDEATKVKEAEAIEAEKKRKRLEAGKRFTMTGMVDLSEFMDVDPNMPPEKKLQQVMSKAR